VSRTKRKHTTNGGSYSLPHALPGVSGRTSLLPGTMVAGRYRVERRVASGGMGEVWEAEHVELRLRVAIKTLRPEASTNHELLARFSREAFLLGRVQSDHVARVLDFVVDDRLGPVLVMEFVEGQSLAHVLEAKRLTIEEAIDLGIDIVSGLRELHRAHVVHRDVKPANVMLRPVADGRFRAVFVDLGVGRLVFETKPHDDLCLTEITGTDRAVGTIEYMAPEQILSSRNVTAAADLYAVGAILYRAVAGHHAFGEARGVDLVKAKLGGPAPPLQTFRGDRVATGFEELIARTLSSTPEDRFETADEMLADLSLLRDIARRTAASELSTRPTRPMPALRRKATQDRRKTQPPPASAKNRSWSAGAIAAAFVLAAGGLIGAFVARRSSAHAAVPAADLSSHFDAERCTVTMRPSGEGSAARSTFTIVCGERAPAVAPRPDPAH